MSEWKEARGLPLFERVLKIKLIFRVSYRTVLYRLSEHGYGSDLWMQFQVAHKRRFGHGLKKADEPQGLPPTDFQAAIVEPRAADEPRRLSADDFVEDRLCSLVRAAVDKQMIGSPLGLVGGFSQCNTSSKTHAQAPALVTRWGLWTCGAAPASPWTTHGRQTAAVHGLPTGSQARRGPTGSTTPTAARRLAWNRSGGQQAGQRRRGLVREADGQWPLSAWLRANETRGRAACPSSRA
jgi:hypothetical protein